MMEKIDLVSHEASLMREREYSVVTMEAHTATRRKLDLKYATTMHSRARASFGEPC